MIQSKSWRFLDTATSQERRRRQRRRCSRLPKFMLKYVTHSTRMLLNNHANYTTSIHFRTADNVDSGLFYCLIGVLYLGRNFNASMSREINNYRVSITMTSFQE